VTFGGKSRAYAALAGGGVKAAALVGGLAAAADSGIEFEGYAGTSAGALVALLAAMRWSPERQWQTLKHLSMSNFLLPDDGKALEAVNHAVAGNVRNLARLAALWKGKDALWRLWRCGGIYSIDALSQFIRERCFETYPDLGNTPEFTFTDLMSQGCKPLKVVVADLRSRRGLLCGAQRDDCLDGPVSTLLACSMSYPLCFRPTVWREMLLTDGGVSNNLPVFAFEYEALQTRIPVISFDLSSSGDKRTSADVRFSSVLYSAIDTSINSGQAIQNRAAQRSRVPQVSQVRIEVGEMSALKLDLSTSEKEKLYRLGYEATQKAISEDLYWSVAFQATTAAEQLQVRYGTSPLAVSRLLDSVLKSPEYAAHSMAAPQFAALCLRDVHGFFQPVYLSSTVSEMAGVERLSRLYIEVVKENSPMIVGSDWTGVTDKIAITFRTGETAEALSWIALPIHIDQLRRDHVLGILLVGSNIPLEATGWIRGDVGAEFIRDFIDWDFVFRSFFGTT
jgi:predicted acylesterase/phospholipase RssA